MSAYRFYDELAPWWPLISPVGDYTEESAYFAGLLARAAALPVREVLELGSGGGHVAFHLKRSFTVTLCDLAPAMIEASRRLNPECEHLVGDMRALRLGREFDAVLIHDAIDYMTTEDDLARAIATAFAHCRPGGVAVFAPDHLREGFAESAADDGHDAHEDDGRSLRYLEWAWDPDPGDTEILVEYAFLLREPGAPVRCVHETHRCGLFPRDTWLRVIADAGFTPAVVIEETTEDREPREVFLGRRPLT